MLLNFSRRILMRFVFTFFIMILISGSVLSAEMPVDLIGKYDISAACKQDSDSMLVIEKNDIQGYEWHCNVSKVTGSKGAYSVQQNCESEGEAFKQTNKYQISGDLLFVDKTKYFKCGAGLNPVKAVSGTSSKASLECSISPDVGGDLTFLDEKLSKKGTDFNSRSGYTFKVSKKYLTKRGKDSIEVLQGQLLGYNGKVLEQISYT